MSAFIVETAYGKVKGEQNGKISVWKGIPYAKPPVGSLRFRAPEIPISWRNVRDATKFSPVALQTPSEVMKFLGSELEETNEDCLYLNIWSPAADNKLRPVMVWVHGGAFAAGSGSSSMYDGTSFASEGDVVVVTFNYRLGVFGFLHVGDVGGDEFAGSGNCGILDQVAALQWVKDNIANFGGDPDRVTVFGESAGAMSIGVLLASPSAKGLFRQAILQSGAAANVHSTAVAEKVTNRFLELLDIGPGDLAKLKEIPAEQLIKKAVLLPYMSLVPVIDGVTLLQHPEQVLAEGGANDISILIGTNKDEYRLFSYFDPRWEKGDEKEITSIFEQTFGSNWEGISRKFPKDEKLTQTMYDELLTMKVFTLPAIRLAEHQVKQKAPVWMYRFDWESTVFEGKLKSCHALEIPFVWNTNGKPGMEKFTGEDTSEKRTLSYNMHQAWINFAHNGNPSTPDLPKWPAYDLENRSVLLFNSENSLEHDPNSEERRSWDKSEIHA